MKNSRSRILGLAATLGIGIALFAATMGSAARADGDDWRYNDRYDQYDHIRYEQQQRQRDWQAAQAHRRFEEAQARRIAQERRIEQERRDHERYERERRDHERFDRERRDRDHRDAIRFDLQFGSETHGDHSWR